MNGPIRGAPPRMRRPVPGLTDSSPLTPDELAELSDNRKQREIEGLALPYTGPTYGVRERAHREEVRRLHWQWAAFTAIAALLAFWWGAVYAHDVALQDAKETALYDYQACSQDPPPR